MTNELFDRLTLGSSYQRLFAFCKSVGISRINVEYSGGGDSGGPDNVEILPKVSKEVADFVHNDLAEELSNPIYDRHGSFADGGGYSVNGTVVYDIENNKAWIEGVDHYYEYSESENEDEEGEETSNDEEWDEMLYDHEDGDNELGEERDYKFALEYAKLTKKSFTDAIHNQMSAAAITGDENAKEYMAWASKN